MPVNETLVLNDYTEYAKLVTDAYEKLPIFDKKVVKHWDSLIKSCYIWWTRLISQTDIIFVTEDKKNVGEFTIKGKTYPIIFWEGGQPYANATEMRNDYKKSKKLYISIDYSEHPVWSVQDNVIFRSVHDYVVHIRGNNEFGLRGEYKAYNLHMKLAPNDALPALFTEIIGQVSVAIIKDIFPVQKIAKIEGFDYVKLGNVDGYSVEKKQLIKI